MEPSTSLLAIYALMEPTGKEGFPSSRSSFLRHSGLKGYLKGVICLEISKIQQLKQMRWNEINTITAGEFSIPQVYKKYQVFFPEAIFKL